MIARSLWPVALIYDEITVFDGLIAPGLHLSVTYDRDEDFYEVILRREPSVTQQDAGAAWGRIAAEIWQLADE